MSDDVKEDNCRPRSATVMVGHTIDNATGEAFVALYSGRSDIIAKIGARILAAQIVQWADHAEKRNAERPKESIARFMYRVLDDAEQWQHVDDEAVKVADTNKDAPGIEVLSEIDEVPASFPRKKPRKRKAKRGRK